MSEVNDTWSENGRQHPNIREYATAFVDMEPHIDTLIALATECETILEFGVRSGVSSWAFLTGLPKHGRLISVDNDERILKEGWLPHQVTTDERFTFIEANDIDANTIAQYPTNPDLVFIDTSHEYEHTLSELTIARGLGANRIALHDSVLEDVKKAVNSFLIKYPEYGILFEESSQWGLMVLEHAIQE